MSDIRTENSQKCGFSREKGTSYPAQKKILICRIHRQPGTFYFQHKKILWFVQFIQNLEHFIWKKNCEKSGNPLKSAKSCNVQEWYLNRDKLQVTPAVYRFHSCWSGYFYQL